MLIGIMLSVVLMAMMFLAQWYVKSSFNKFSQVPARQGLTGAQVARQILDANGLNNVGVESIQGELTDHYDPRDKMLRLSEPVYGSRSLAAFGVAAHEAGHAIQDRQGYIPLQLRQGIYPLASIGSSFGVLLIPVGVILAMFTGVIGVGVAMLGLALYAMAVLFSVITLPVEFDASRRALVALEQGGMMSSEEVTGARKVLNAAAMTYVAATIGAVATLLYYVWMLFGAAQEE